jgi:hypothetical protein
MIGAVAVTMVLAGAGLAGASARPAAAGTEHFQLMTTSATARTSSVIATGLFTAGGTDTRTTNATDTVTFPTGTFVITHSKGTGSQSFNPKTCLFTASVKGTYKLGSGTGAYANISGNGNYRVSILAVAAKSGGKCSKTGPPATWQQTINASGPVSLH